MRRISLVAALVLALAAPAARAVTQDMLAPGTNLEVTLDRTLSTQSTKPGDRFSATIARPVVTPGGQTLVPAGSRVIGEVTNVQRPTNGQKPALKLDFKQLEIAGVDHPLRAKVTNVNLAIGKSTSKTKRNAVIGGVGGAVLGGVVHGWKGALVGGALGAGGGTVIGLETSGKEAKIDKGSAMTLQTTEPASIGPAAPAQR